MIQIITKNKKAYEGKFNKAKVDILNFDEYKSFDLYDINIINLASNDLWNSNSTSGDSLNDKTDLVTLKKAIETSRKKVLICFPQNHQFKYNFSIYSEKFMNSKQLKSMKIEVEKFISEYIYEPIPNFEYEKGKTKIEKEEFDSDFYFLNDEGIIMCEGSKKINTLCLEDKLFITSLNIFSTPADPQIEKRLNIILKKIGFLDNQEKAPKWIENIIFYDDEIYIKKLKECDEEIKKIEKIKGENIEKLNENSKYKSILYSTGQKLSNQINELLIEIFEIDEKFNDVYEEDFKFKYNDVTFIIETKGLNNEVSGQNISDAFNHLVIYEDELEKKGIIEETKCLFFVANERHKIPSERAKINERQITIASRNKTLIIETYTFYQIYESFKKGELKKEEIFEMFNNKTGILKI